jgi:hypothetical protein
MSHVGLPSTSSTAVGALEALIAQYRADAHEYRELAARMDAAALCSRFVRDLELLRASASAPTVGLGSGTGVVTPAPVGQLAHEQPRRRSKPNVTVHQERATAALQSVEHGNRDGYDPVADARSTLAQLRISQGGAQ